MRTLRRLAETRWADWADIARAYVYLLMAGWRLYIRRQRLDRWLSGQWAQEGPSELAAKEQHNVASAARWTNAAARHPLPWARCLQRSLALCLWLEDMGLHPALRIGVRREGKGISAHAWVEYKGHILNDSQEVGETFSTLSTGPLPGIVPGHGVNKL